MRVLVTGSSGFVGRHLISRLTAMGNVAVPLNRGSTADAAAFAGPSDLNEIERWPAWPRDIDAVIHLAALNPERGSAMDQAVLDRANANATAALARRCVAERVRRIVYVSTALVHPSAPNAFDEEAAVLPQNAYARSKLKGEELFWAALAGSSTEGCVVRPVPVYGPGGRGMIGALLKLSRLPVPLPLAGLGGRRSIVSVHNLTDALVRCAQSPEAAGATFFVADEAPMTVTEIVSAFRSALGRPPGLLPAPRAALGAIAKFAGKADIWNSLNASFVVDCGNIERRLAWRPIVDSKSALAELAAHVAITSLGK